MPNRLINKDTKIVYLDEFKPLDRNYVSSKLGIPTPVLDIWNNWVEIENELFYLKTISSQNALIKSLIGEVVTSRFNLESAKHNIAKVNMELPLIKKQLETIGFGVLSKNFRQDDSSYLHINELLNPNEVSHGSLFKRSEYIYKLNDLKNLCLTNKNKTEIEMDTTKLIVRDFYTDESDRRCCNFCFKINNEGIRLAPLYDYEGSFNYVSKYSNSVFGKLSFDKKHYPTIKNEFPMIGEVVDMAFDLNIKTVVEEVEDTHKIIIPNYIKEKYILHDFEKKKILSKIKE